MYTATVSLQAEVKIRGRNMVCVYNKYELVSIAYKKAKKYIGNDPFYEDEFTVKRGNQMFHFSVLDAALKFIEENYKIVFSAKAIDKYRANFTLESVV